MGGGLQNRSNICAVPLSKLQTALLQLIAANRNPESYIAGAIALNRDGPRYSGDIDIFHDGDARLVATAEADAATIATAGFELTWTSARGTGKRSAVVTGLGESTQLDWVADSDYRFFPTMPDPLFGYVLHPVDIATNKAVAAADRRVPRDIVDLLTVHRRILPLGAVVCAAVGRFPGPTPEQMLADIRRHGRFTADEFRSLAMDVPIDPGETVREIGSMLDDAEAFVLKVPSDAVGFVFLEGGDPVQPDPGCLERYVKHPGQRRGHWPTSSEIGSAMLDRHVGKPKTSPDES